MREIGETNNRLYWLKLKKDFFKRHDIKIIEGMENGKDYVLFYLKLLCESLDHNGNLRFSDTIPYSESMLASVTGTNIDIVRSAMKVLINLNLVEVWEDQTICMCEVEKMAGSESKWAGIKRLQRAEKAELGQCPNDVQQLSADCPTEYRDKSIEYRNNTTPVEKSIIENQCACAHAREGELSETKRRNAMGEINNHLRLNCNLLGIRQTLNDAVESDPKIQTSINALEKLLSILYWPVTEGDLKAALQLTEETFFKVLNKFISPYTVIENEEAYVWTSVYNAIKENDNG